MAGGLARLTPLHKVLTPQTDIFESLSSGKVRVPGADDSQLPYLRDIRDHLRKQSDLTDSYRDLSSTIFLPLSFLTGFFGQNFGALVGHITGWPAFIGFGLGSEVVAVFLLYLLFRRRGWLKSRPPRRRLLSRAA